ncbi:MAG: glycosyltransferase family 9 protein [Elusimicrobia bacterium]|nr:glycosyltransferase family 9 protein [Elusimicrobiota bacterium]
MKIAGNSDKLKFLLIRFSSLGDTVLVTPVIENILKNSPGSIIDVMTKQEYVPVFEHNPGVSAVVTGIGFKKKYDYLIDLHDSIRSNIYKYIIPARKRLTYNKAAFARRAYLHARRPDKQLGKSVIERYLQPLRKIGFKTEPVPPRIYLTREEMEDAAQVNGGNRYVAIAPGARWNTKQWTVENYVSLIIKIIKEIGMNSVIIGDACDRELADNILKETGLLKKHVINLAGRISIRQSAAVIKNSAVLVSTDSAPMHIGWAVGARVVALFGPTVKEFGFQPADPGVRILEKEMKCRPCSLHGSDRCRFKDRACMQRIEVYEVMDVIRDFIADGRA